METSELIEIINNGYITEGICVVIGASLNYAYKRIWDKKELTDPLIKLEDYPVEFDYEANKVKLNFKKLNKTIDFLLKNKNLVATEQLAYLIHKNKFRNKMSEAEQKNYDNLLLLRKINIKNVEKEIDDLINSFRNDVLSEYYQHQYLPQEYILHNILNPFSSIVEIMSELTGRKKGDPATSFAIELIEKYRKDKYTVRDFSAYKVQRQPLRGTTTVLEDKKHGLFGFKCVNLDMDKMRKLLVDREYLENLVLQACTTQYRINENIKVFYN